MGHIKKKEKAIGISFYALFSLVSILLWPLTVFPLTPTEVFDFIYTDHLQVS
jgi:uncharacterized BrkB/YihY/UPF0761 family membrane protein